ncbi:MAG: hypothetical protein IIB39_09460 [Candidatus Marinimicrobia bacterium]|nr:hypothetical protein [Candidatus Neomarinimicrobiota bacterium]
MDNKTPEVIYLSLSEETNALDYLELAAAFVKKTPDNVTAWKWVVISLHGALYGFAVAASRGTDYENILRKNGYLLGFWKVLNKCQDPNHMKMLENSKHLELTDSQSDSINILVARLRNNFQHFKPRLWSIEIHGMPQIAIDILEVIRFLARETHTYVHLSDEEEILVDKLVKESIDFIEGTELYAELKLGKELYQKKNSALRKLK